MFTLQQALEAVANKPEFSVKDKGDYTVIDYNYNSRETFVGDTHAQTKILLNLRGTAFDNATGNIIRLGFSKFFNLGEFPETDKLLDFSDDHVILQKIDGSMCAPIYCDDTFVWGTRAGVTDVSKLVDVWLDKNPDLNDRYTKFVNVCKLRGMTPIFEFVSKENRVVIDYKKTDMILTGIRCMDTGDYIDYADMTEFTADFNIPVVQLMGKVGNKSFAQIVDDTWNLVNDEGIVVKFESGPIDGHMVKVKSVDYVNLHKTVDGLKWEHDVVKLILNNKLDDVYPLVSDEKKSQLEIYSSEFIVRFMNAVVEIRVLNINNILLDGKELAGSIKDSKYRSFIFSMRKSNPLSVEVMLKQFCLKKCSGQTSVKELREFLGMVLEYN